jgi:tetratricopeptide (TPR) repeat protein
MMDHLPNNDSTPVASEVPSRPEALLWVLTVVLVVSVGVAGFLIGRATAPEGSEEVATIERSAGDLLAEAVALHSSGLVDAAADRYEAILAIESENALALYNLGQISQQRGEPERALDLYGRAIASDPSLISAAYNRAIALRDLGRVDQAVAAFEVILANDPDSVGVLFNLGNLYIELGDVERGVALVNRAVVLDPSLRGE